MEPTTTTELQALINERAERQFKQTWSEAITQINNILCPLLAGFATDSDDPKFSDNEKFIADFLGKFSLRHGFSRFAIPAWGIERAKREATQRFFNKVVDMSTKALEERINMVDEHVHDVYDDLATLQATTSERFEALNRTMMSMNTEVKVEDQVEVYCDGHRCEVEKGEV